MKAPSCQAFLPSKALFLRRTLGPSSICRLQAEVHQQQVIVRYFGLLPHQQLRVRRFCIGLLIPMRQDSENETWRAFVSVARAEMEPLLSSEHRLTTDWYIHAQYP